MVTKIYKIKDILEFQKKSHRKAGEGLEKGSYPFFTSSQIQKKWCETADYKKESIIIGTGGGASVHCSKNFSTSTDVFVLSPTDKNISSKYIAYFLLGNKDILQKGFKGSGLKHISRNYVEKIEIPIPLDKNENPSIEEQERIVELLEEAKNIKDKRIESDKKMAEIIPALFNKTFGDILKSDKSMWATLADLTEKIVVGHVGPTSHGYSDSGVPFLRTNNVRPMRIDKKEIKYITTEFDNKLKKSKLKTNDVVISRVGVNRGMSAVIPSDLDGANCANIIILRLDGRLNPYFLSFLLNSSFGQHSLMGMSVGSAQGVINTGSIKRFHIPLPSISSQNKFSTAIINLVDTMEKQKETNKSIEELFSSILSTL